MQELRAGSFNKDWIVRPATSAFAVLVTAAGFNAIRSLHNPISRAMLDAADEHGMLVMDEAFDFWAEGKGDFDYSLDFPEWRERDIEAMVNKDINHPSVVLYSLGNEIFGSSWGRPA